MMGVLGAFTALFDKYGDPRTKDWLLMSNPLPTALICAVYIFIAKIAGPRLMANRKPMELRKFIILYNFFQVIFSSWLFYELMMGGWWGEYSFICQPVDYSNKPSALRMVNACRWHYFSRLTEFMDTLFLILRKKDKQITNLHVIHHGMLPLSTYFIIKFTPGGHGIFTGLVNTFVHIIMYTYYMLAAIGPNVQKYLWWKKYLTTLQLIEFLGITVHAFQLLFIDCDYPKVFAWYIGMHGILFIFLYTKLYNQTYTKASKQMVTDKSKPMVTNLTKSMNRYSKPADNHITDDGLSRFDLVHRTTARVN